MGIEQRLLGWVPFLVSRPFGVREVRYAVGLRQAGRLRRPHDPYGFGLPFEVQVPDVDDIVDSKAADSVEGVQVFELLVGDVHRLKPCAATGFPDR